MGTALLITIDHKVKELPMPPGENGETLRFMYEAIGCDTVDVVRLTDALDMWVDDNGLMTQPVNRLGTYLARTYGYRHQPYFGNVLITGRAGPDAVALAPDQVRTVLWRLGVTTAEIEP